MGIDLTLLPIHYWSKEFNRASAWTVLPFGKVSGDELFRELHDLEKYKGIMTPLNFDTPFNEEIPDDNHHTIHTPYGDRIRAVEVRELLEFKDHHEVLEDEVRRAVFGYLLSCPLDLKIAFYWT